MHSVPNVTTISTAALRDSRLSFGARGFLAGMIANEGEMLDHSDPESARLLAELEANGYVQRSTGPDGIPVLTVTDIPDGVL